jgi:FkbM family methyltransferase
MSKFNLAEYEQMHPRVDLEGVTYFIPNQHCLWRVDSLRQKEPDTLEWITTFNKDDIFIDIGANVGMYTLWASVKYGITTYAFEPESQNYALLCKNIMVNQVQDKALAYCIAISDDTAENSNVLFDRLNLSQFTIGGSCHSFGDEVDFNLDARTSAFRQGSICISLDHFIKTSEIKDSNANLHIKIDVDGIEHKVISSAMNSIRNKRTKSVLIELNTKLKLHNKIIGLMEALGYTTTIHPDAIRKEGPFKGIGNHIFIRKS